MISNRSTAFYRFQFEEVSYESVYAVISMNVKLHDLYIRLRFYDGALTETSFVRKIASMVIVKENGNRISDEIDLYIREFQKS